MLRKKRNLSVSRSGAATLGLLSLVGSLAIAVPAFADGAEPVAATDENSIQQEGSVSETGDSAQQASPGAQSTDIAPAEGGPESGAAPTEIQPRSDAPAETSVPDVASPAASPEITECHIPQGHYRGSVPKSGTRFGGVDRYDTATKIAKAVDSQAEGATSALFVASGRDFADAVSLGALAAYTDWPIVLANKNSLDSETIELIKKEKPTDIYIAGGTGAVSQKVQDQIVALAGTSPEHVTRFAGVNRFETSAQIANCFDPGTPVFLATGDTFSDATVAGAPAAKVGGAVILTMGAKANAAALGAVETLKPSKVYTIGGAWSASQQNAIKAVSAPGVALTSISGKDKYETSAKVANAFFGTGDKTIAFASGSSFADALTGVSIADLSGGAIVLTRQTCRPKQIETVAKTAKVRYMLGGKGAVSDASATTTCVPPPPPPPPPPTRSVGQRILDAAWSRRGMPYESGAVGPGSFDCSGLTSWSYSQVGITIPRTTWGQLAGGTRVSDPQPGDVVVLGGGSHVGIYAGSGMMVDAGNYQTGVVVRAMYEAPMAFVRFW